MGKRLSYTFLILKKKKIVLIAEDVLTCEKATKIIARGETPGTVKKINRSLKVSNINI